MEELFPHLSQNGKTLKAVDMINHICMLWYAEQPLRKLYKNKHSKHDN